jgi:hypothetical protein
MVVITRSMNKNNNKTTYNIDNNNNNKNNNNNNNIELKIDIDFDESSREWRKNKKNIGNCHFEYICLQLTHLKSICNRKCKLGSLFCKKHSPKEKNVILI